MDGERAKKEEEEEEKEEEEEEEEEEVAEVAEAEEEENGEGKEERGERGEEEEEGGGGGGGGILGAVLTVGRVTARGYANAARSLQSLQRAKTSTARRTGAMPYLGVTLPAALTHPCDSFHGYLLLALLSPLDRDPRVLELEQEGIYGCNINGLRLWELEDSS
uniref:Uncharacterized protein n=1 Tax=Vespula pensylvanica TaxID=30213 RepID=A0A834JYT7_VESPE|nr:hypothetical protein H0235_016489 [Vespula pensylvanica]